MRRLTLFLFFLSLALTKVFGQGNVTTYEYDEGGNVVKRTVHSESNKEFGNIALYAG